LRNILTNNLKCKIILFILIFFPGKIYTQFRWTTITYQGNIKRIIYQDDYLWGVTTGGLFRIDLINNIIEKYTNIDGLSSINCRTGILDENGNLWVGMSDGTINVYNKNKDRWKIINIEPGKLTINDMQFYKNRLYIASEIGISEYLTGKNEIRSTFRNLGEFEINTEVNTIFLYKDTLWAGTNKGIAFTDINSPNLQDPQYWKNFTDKDGLPDLNINNFEVYNSRLYCATNIDIISFDGKSWKREWVRYGKYTFLTVKNEKLFACGEKGVFKKEKGKGWIKTGNKIKNATSIEIDRYGNFWASTSGNGLYILDNNTFKKFDINSPGGKTFAGMIQDIDGILWFVSGGYENQGIYSLDGNIWKNYTIDDGLTSSSFFSVAVDKSNRKWFGTPGNGAMILENNNKLSISKIDTTEGLLAGSDTPTFVIVGDIKVDSYGNIWLINNFANNGKPLVVVTPDFKFYYFSINDGLSSNELNKIEFDLNENVWIGTAKNGIDILNYNTTIKDKSDDVWSHISTADGLNSNRIRALKVDNTGIMWIGTGEGINYWYNGKVYTQYGALDNYINCIEVDPVNNKWFGTNTGVSILSPDNFSWTYFTKENSFLIDNQILSILALNNGNVYIGTGNGLSILETPFKNPEKDFNKLVIYPNPFIISEGKNRLVVEGLPLHTKIKIFTTSGILIRELNEENQGIIGTQAYWDGKDNKGVYASSGIYLIAAFFKNGKGKVSKLAVIKR